MTKKLPLSLLNPAGNLRSLQDHFVKELLNKMETQTIDPAFPILVKGPMENGTYIIINGQHRFAACTMYYEKKNTPLSMRVLNCMIYKPTLKLSDELVLAANPDRTSLADETFTKYNRLRTYFQDSRSRNETINLQRIAIQYSPKETPESNQWVYQLRKVCEFPFDTKFASLNIKSESLNCRGMKNPKARQGKNATQDNKKLIFTQFKYDINEKPDLRDESENFGGYLYFLQGRCLLHHYSYTNTGYASAWKMLCYGASSLASFLVPRQIAPIIEEYLDSLDSVLDNVEGDESAKKVAAKNCNDQFISFCSILSGILTYLHNQVKSVPTSVLPPLPQEMRYASEIEVKDLELGDIYHLVRTLLPDDDFQSIYDYNWARQRKNALVETFFNSNIGAGIFDRWKALFTDQTVRTIPVSNDVFFAPHKRLTLNEKEYCFWNSCAFAFLENAFLKKEKFNLIIGDIPVSSSLVCKSGKRLQESFVTLNFHSFDFEKLNWKKITGIFLYIYFINTNLSSYH